MPGIIAPATLTVITPPPFSATAVVGQTIQAGAAPDGAVIQAPSAASDNRIGIVFLGDGYTAGEIATVYNDHVTGLLNYMFGGSRLTEPFGRYENFFSIYRIPVISNQSGTSNSPADLNVDNALGSRYFVSDIERSLYVDTAKTSAAVARAVFRAVRKRLAKRAAVLDRLASGQAGGSSGIPLGPTKKLTTTRRTRTTTVGQGEKVTRRSAPWCQPPWPTVVLRVLRVEKNGVSFK